MTPTLAILILKILPKKFLAILHTLWIYEREVRMKKYSAVFPNRETIAKRSGCSLGRVKQFNAWFADKPDALVIKKRWCPKTKRYSSNIYKLGEEFFEIMTMLDGLGYFRKWGSLKEDLFEKVSENERFIYDMWKVKNNKLAEASPAKLADTKEVLFTKEVMIKVPEKKGTGTHSSLILDFGFNQEVMHIADHYCTRQAVLDARNDVIWYVKQGNVMKNKNAVMKDALTRNAKRQFDFINNNIFRKRN